MKCPPFALQRRAQWLWICAAFLAIIGVVAMVQGATQALAGQSTAFTGSSVVPVVVFPPVDLPSTEVAFTSAPDETTLASSSADSFQVEAADTYIHTVRSGEYWIGIANRFGVSYAELRTVNADLWSMRHEIIRPGDQMVIPGLAAEEMPDPVNYVVQSGDSWYRIADSFGLPFWELRLDNADLWQRRGVYIRPGDELVVKDRGEYAVVNSAPGERTAAALGAPAAGSVVTLPSSSADAPVLVGSIPGDASLYTVRPGDTWFSIAAAHGIAFPDLRNANPTLWSARGQDIRPADQMIIPAHGSPLPPPEIRNELVEEVAPPEPSTPELFERPVPTPADPEAAGG